MKRRVARFQVRNHSADPMAVHATPHRLGKSAFVERAADEVTLEAEVGHEVRVNVGESGEESRQVDIDVLRDLDVDDLLWESGRLESQSGRSGPRRLQRNSASPDLSVSTAESPAVITVLPPVSDSIDFRLT